MSSQEPREGKSPSPTDADLAIRRAVEQAFGSDALSLLDETSDRRRRLTSSASTIAAAADPLEALVATIDREHQLQRPRAIDIAQAKAKGGGEVETPTSFVVFSIAGTFCAVPLSGVLEIQRPPVVTWIPNLPEWVLGVSNLRGEILSVVDLRRFFGLAGIAQDEASRIVVVRSQDHEMSAGLIVDKVIGITGIVPGRIAPYSPQSLGSLSTYLRGAVEDKGRVVAMMDLEALLQSREMQQFQLN